MNPETTLILILIGMSLLLVGIKFIKAYIDDKVISDKEMSEIEELTMKQLAYIALTVKASEYSKEEFVDKVVDVYISMAYDNIQAMSAFNRDYIKKVLTPEIEKIYEMDKN